MMMMVAVVVCEGGGCMMLVRVTAMVMRMLMNPGCCNLGMGICWRL